MTPKDPFLEGTLWDKFWRPIRSRALLFTPDFFFCGFGPFSAGKSHPWTNASVGGNPRRTFRTIGPYEFPQGNSYGPMIGPYDFPPKFVWTNGAQSSVKVSVLTGIGP